MNDEDTASFKRSIANALGGNAPSILEVCIRTNSSRLNKQTQEECNQLEERGAFSRKAVEKLVGAMESNHKMLQSISTALKESPHTMESTVVAENERLTAKLAEMEQKYGEMQVLLTEAQRDVKDHKNFSASVKEKLGIVTIERDGFESKLILAERKLDKLGSSVDAIPAPVIANT